MTTSFYITLPQLSCRPIGGSAVSLCIEMLLYGCVIFSLQPRLRYHAMRIAVCKQFVHISVTSFPYILAFIEYLLSFRAFVQSVSYDTTKLLPSLFCLILFVCFYGKFSLNAILNKSASPTSSRFMADFSCLDGMNRYFNTTPQCSIFSYAYMVSHIFFECNRFH